MTGWCLVLRKNIRGMSGKKATVFSVRSLFALTHCQRLSFLTFVNFRDSLFCQLGGGKANL